jgi:hypothetical protein
MNAETYQSKIKKIGSILSHLLNVPVLTGMLLLFFYYDLPAATPYRTSGFILSLGLLCLVPLSSYLFYLPGKETDHEKILHRQRMASFIIMMVSYPIGWLVLVLSHSPAIFIITAINYTCITIGLLIINLALKYKASGAMIYLFGLAATPLLALLPIISWARIRAKGHNFLQTVIGSALSFAITVLIFWAAGYHPFNGLLK